MSRVMKDSGIEWIGDIPVDWDVVKLKSEFRYEKGKNASTYTQEYVGENKGSYPVYSGQTEGDGIMGQIDSFDYDLPECVFSTTVGAKAMTPKFLQGKFSLSQNCLIMHSINSYKCKLLYYALFPLFFYEKDLIPSHMQPSLRYSDLNKYFIPLPSITEQKKIADHLDKKCWKIDEAVETQKNIIEKLKEYKQSLITETVCRGLDAKALLKDSGIEWIGKIPNHWNSKCPVRICNVTRGNTSFTKEDLKNKGEFVAVQYGKTYKTDIIDINFSYFVEKSFFKEDQVVKNGDSIYITTSETVEDFGHVAYYERNDDGLLGGEQVCFHPDNNLFDSKYFYFSLRCLHFDLKRFLTGLKVFRVNISDFKNTIIPIPPIEEQQEIANYLDEKCEKIDHTIKQKEISIEKLLEYKKSLIFECVTGKKEVL